ncbi:SAV0927 family protein, partial [Staphylococcus aureus]
TDDLKEEGYIAHILGVNAEEGDEITEYLNEEPSLKIKTPN